jgi:uncharacterized membrane protein YeaQ/YmgE (transglycosylase-associated protein family)
MQYVWMAIIGLIVGALAKLIMPGEDPGGIIITILLGIAGSFVGSFIGRALGFYQPGQAAGFIMSHYRRDHTSVAVSGDIQEIRRLA